MRYKIPQFVDMEDKIFGPVTMRQLAILGVGGAVAYVGYMRFGTAWPLVSVPAGIVAVVFAFVRVQDMTFFRYLLAALQYLLRPERRVWTQHADYIRPPLDLFQKKEKKTSENTVDQDRQLLKKVNNFAAVLDGGTENLTFTSFHNEKKQEQTIKRFDTMQQSNTKVVQDRVKRFREVIRAKQAPISKNSRKF